jgi:hypothetical protein
MGQNKRQGAGPEGHRQGLGLGRQGRDAPDGIDVRHMHDQRIERLGRPLAAKMRATASGLSRVGGQPVDGLRRHGHESAPPQKRRGACDRRLAGIEHLGDLIGHP